MNIEQTLVLVKPDGVARGLIGEIITRFERRGLKIAALRMLRFDVALADRHYAEHVKKGFYPDLRKCITSAPVVATVVQGDKAISAVRALMGATKFFEAAPGTIRGDFALSVTENLVHGSDSAESAAREIPLYFNPEQIF